MKKVTKEHTQLCMFFCYSINILTEKTMYVKIYIIQQNKNFVELGIGRFIAKATYIGIFAQEALIWQIYVITRMFPLMSETF